MRMQRGGVVVLATLIFVWSNAPAEALPFSPDFATIVPLSAVFTSTGTSTLCLQCNDGDPLNNFIATLSVGFPIGVPPNTFAAMFGSVSWADSSSSTAPVFNEPIQYRVRVSATDLNNPEYPFPSVVEGTLHGFFLGVHDFNDTFLVVNCCAGFVNGVQFQAGGLQPLRPFSMGGDFFPIDVHFFPAQAVVPDAIPEPTSLMTLGPALVALLRAHRRKQL